MKYESKDALVDDIRTAHAELIERLATIPSARWRESGVWGDGWNVVDLIAHLAEWQHMFLGWYDAGLRGHDPALPAPGYKWNETPRLNRAIWEKHRSRSAKAVRAEFDAGHERILHVVAASTPAQLFDSGHFAWTGKHSLVTYIGPNTASHYRFASKVLARWLKATAVAEDESRVTSSKRRSQGVARAAKPGRRATRPQSRD